MPTVPVFSALRAARWLLAVLALTLALPALAQDAAIRKALKERLPNLPEIDEVRPTPVPGVFEVLFAGTEILYSDAGGDHIFIEGAMIDTRTMTNLTDARLKKLMAIDFDKLPLKDAFVFKQGTGARRVAVFADPNCGYCKRFERDLLSVKDVTIYTFLLPILGPDSVAKSRNIWCAKNAGQAWRAWMLDNKLPPEAAARCDSKALDRNREFGRKHRINGTPALVFEDGTRRPGALPADQVERHLAEAAKKS